MDGVSFHHKLHVAANFNARQFCNNGDTVSVLAHDYSLISQKIFAKASDCQDLFSTVKSGGAGQKDPSLTLGASDVEGKQRKETKIWNGGQYWGEMLETR